MTHRVSNFAPLGALFKRPRPIQRPLKTAKPVKDAEHLEAVRQCPCVSCGQDPCGEAAHVRMGSLAGMGRKPEDRYTVALCHACHMEQHRVGELTFWSALGIDPHVLAKHLWNATSTEAKRAICLVARVLAGDGK
jgi:hypothetical protein